MGDTETLQSHYCWSTDQLEFSSISILYSKGSKKHQITSSLFCILILFFLFLEVKSTASTFFNWICLVTFNNRFVIVFIIFLYQEIKCLAKKFKAIIEKLKCRAKDLGSFLPKDFKILLKSVTSPLANMGNIFAGYSAHALDTLIF